MCSNDCDPAIRLEYEIRRIKDTKYDECASCPAITFAPADQYPSPVRGNTVHSSSSPPAVINAVRDKLSAISPAITFDFHVLHTDIQNVCAQRMMACSRFSGTGGAAGDDRFV